MLETVTYQADQTGESLDVFLVRQQPDFSRAHVQKLLRDGGALVDGRVRKANYKLNGNEIITLTIPEAESVEIKAEDIPLDILYEDEDIIVVNKARGMVVHPASGVNTGTLVNALLFHCQDLSGINGEIRPGIVHRLDKDTSGVMVCAKNDKAHINLAEQIRTKSAHRIYRAVVHGNIKEEAGIIKGDIGRHLAAELVGIGNFAAHLVEGRGQLADFIRGSDPDFLLQLSLGDLARCAGQGLQRAGKRAGEQQSQQHGQHQRSAQCNQQALVGALQEHGLGRIVTRQAVDG